MVKLNSQMVAKMEPPAMKEHTSLTEEVNLLLFGEFETI